MNPIRTIIIGAGSRGNTYASYSKSHPDEMQVVAVAEPHSERRRSFAKEYNLNAEQCFSSWENAFKQASLADVAIIATQDQMHVAPALCAIKIGYHVLLEKPMATTKKDCQTLFTAAKQSDKLFGLCHVLRYTSHYQKMKEIIDSGLIGEVITIEHLEPVNYWHMAHSYVRGNWRRLEESSPMILAKSCHDLDLIRWFADSPCKNISSFGSLTHFKENNAPDGSSHRCISDCAVEKECPYSALKLYMNMNLTDWPVSVITNDLSKKGREKALWEGPYGRCVYKSDNDVVDHQVVSMEFQNKVTASFTMSAFTDGHRRTRIMGTMGEIIGNFETMTLSNFRNQKKDVVWEKCEMDEMSHGGGDFRLMKQFLKAVIENDSTLFISSIKASLDSHLMAFAAEESRLETKVVELI